MLFRKIFASIINAVFGLCLCYSWIAGYMYLSSSFGTSKDGMWSFIIFVLLWVIPCILYNFERYEEEINRQVFWTTLLIPLFSWSVLVALIILLFF